MPNRITASIEFSYQGETYRPITCIDLDALLQRHERLPDLHLYLAKQNGIDPYSYLYEVMESHPIHFSEAEGLAKQCLHDQYFDIDAFEALWHESQELAGLAAIAHKQLGIEDLEQEPAVRRALLEAFRLGKSS